MALDWATLAPLLADTAANYGYSSNEAAGYTAKPSTGYELVGDLLLDLNGMGPPAGLPANIRYLSPQETQALLQRSEAESSSGLSNKLGNALGSALPLILAGAGVGAAGGLSGLLGGAEAVGTPYDFGAVEFAAPASSAPLMPPAVAETAQQLAAQGLTQTAPGVWEAAATSGLSPALAQAAGSAAGSAATGAAGTAAGTTAATQGLASLLGIDPATAALLGPLLGTGLGVAGSLSQRNSLEDLAKQQREADAARAATASADSAAQRAAEQARYDDLVRREAERFGVITAREDAAKAQQRADIEFGRGLGAPSRERYEASYAPGFDITKEPALAMAQDSTLDALLRRLSTQSNPFGNPGGLTQVNKDVLSGVALPYLQDYRRTNATTGGLASFGSSGATVPGIGTNLPTTATAGSGTPISGTTTATGGIGPNQFDAGAATAGSNIWNALGSGVADIFTPKNSLADLLKAIGAGGAYGRP